MPGDPHPVEQPYQDHDDAEIIAYHKAHTRVRVADADEVRNTDFSGQFGGLYVRTVGSNFDLDTEDTSDDDGTNVIHDAAGNHFVRSVPTAAAETQRVVSAAGDVAVSTDDTDIIIIDKTVPEATNVLLPPAADATKPVRIVDGGYNAETFNITLVPDGSDVIMGGASYIIDSNGASIKLTPRGDGTGWI